MFEVVMDKVITLKDMTENDDESLMKDSKKCGNICLNIIITMPRS